MKLAVSAKTLKGKGKKKQTVIIQVIHLSDGRVRVDSDRLSVVGEREFAVNHSKLVCRRMVLSPFYSSLFLHSQLVVAEQRKIMQPELGGDCGFPYGENKYTKNV